MASDLMEGFVRTTIATPLGRFTVVAGEAGVVRTAFGDDEAGLHPEIREDTGRMDRLRREVDAYFRGGRRSFETRVDPSALGEGFARRVLEVVRTIPYGEMWTYGDVAAAAGSALARCPIELFVPCHRVVRAGPSLGSYGRHDDRRRFLLRLEGALPDAPRRP